MKRVFQGFNTSKTETKGRLGILVSRFVWIESESTWDEMTNFKGSGDIM